MSESLYRPNKPVWELVGMDIYTYKALPYDQKKLLMRRAGYPIPIKPKDCTCETKVPHWSKWMIGAYQSEMGERISLMGRKAAEQSWKY